MVCNIAQISKTGASPSDCLVLYQDTRWWVSYLSAEMQSVYFTAPAVWAVSFSEKKKILPIMEFISIKGAARPQVCNLRQTAGQVKRRVQSHCHGESANDPWTICFPFCDIMMLFNNCWQFDFHEHINDELYPLCQKDQEQHFGFASNLVITETSTKISQL